MPESERLTLGAHAIKSLSGRCTSCPIIIILVCLAFTTLANPVTQHHKQPASSHRDPSTLVVTDEHHRGTAPKVTTRVGQRDIESSRGSAQGTRRQSRKLIPVDVANMFKEDVRDYPEEEIRRLLKHTPDSVKDLFNVLNTQLDPHMNLTERVASYYNNDEDDGQAVREESVCRTVTRNIYPREANRQNSLVYIPNNQEFMQVIQAEICQHPDRECSYLQDSLPYGMTSVCLQKYAYKKLLFMDPLEKRMASDLFRYPSCCSCFIRTLPFDLRSANGTYHSTPKPQTVAHNLADSHDSVSQYQGESSSYSSGGGPTNQTTDRSQDSTPKASSSGQQRTRKQLHGATNQTLVLSDDKVYRP